MRQSELFPKTLREAPADADNISAALLFKGGFIYKYMSGVLAYQPLGWRVIKKIEQIIREEMNAIGCQELYLTSLQSKELWDKSGRWEKLKGDMYQFKDHSDRNVGLAMTHEEPIIELIGQQSLSYQDFPILLYQFQTKYRNEPRAKSGLIRAREFLMKDAYSNHTSEEDFNAFYEKSKIAYKKIFDRLHIPAVITLASGGIFTSNFSHEFQSPHEIGEDTIYACPEMDYAVNREVLDRVEKVCPNHKKELVEQKAVEVGNIFSYGTKYSEQLGVTFADEKGEQRPFWSGAYGIGLGRAMGMIVEHHHDEQGIIWPKSVAPYHVHLLDLTKTSDEKKQAEQVYNDLTQAGIEVLFDDRAVSPGVKFTDADLLGLPIRLVVSTKTLAENSVEHKERAGNELKRRAIDKLVNELKAD